MSAQSPFSHVVSESLSRRGFLRAGGMLGLAAVVAACGGGGGEGAAGSGKGTIRALFMKQAGYSEENIQEMLASFGKANPDLRFQLVNSTVEEAERSYESSMTMLYEGAILALLVVWAFLRDWRATWISAVALPLSIIPTFAVMYWFGFTLNIITLLALSVVVGILVDDAIVEIENIVRHLRMGKSPMDAAVDAGASLLRGRVRGRGEVGGEPEARLPEGGRVARDHRRGQVERSDRRDDAGRRARAHRHRVPRGQRGGLDPAGAQRRHEVHVVRHRPGPRGARAEDVRP